MVTRFEITEIYAKICTRLTLASEQSTVSTARLRCCRALPDSHPVGRLGSRSDIPTGHLFTLHREADLVHLHHTPPSPSGLEQMHASPNRYRDPR
jgi:hypothetical protein